MALKGELAAPCECAELEAGTSLGRLWHQMRGTYYFG